MSDDGSSDAVKKALEPIWAEVFPEKALDERITRLAAACKEMAEWALELETDLKVAQKQIAGLEDRVRELESEVYPNE